MNIEIKFMNKIEKNNLRAFFSANITIGEEKIIIPSMTLTQNIAGDYFVNIKSIKENYNDEDVYKDTVMLTKGIREEIKRLALIEYGVEETLTQEQQEVVETQTQVQEEVKTDNGINVDEIEF